MVWRCPGMKFEDRLEFNEGDVGLPGVSQTLFATVGLAKKGIWCALLREF